MKGLRRLMPSFLSAIRIFKLLLITLANDESTFSSAKIRWLTKKVVGGISFVGFCVNIADDVI